jgi:hypothetical protein
MSVLAKKWLLSTKGRDLPPRKKNLAKQYFVGVLSGGDRWKLANCNHQEHKEVLEFLIPLLNTEKA